MRSLKRVSLAQIRHGAYCSTSASALSATSSSNVERQGDFNSNPSFHRKTAIQPTEIIVIHLIKTLRTADMTFIVHLDEVRRLLADETRMHLDALDYLAPLKLNIPYPRHSHLSLEDCNALNSECNSFASPSSRHVSEQTRALYVCSTYRVARPQTKHGLSSSATVTLPSAIAICHASNPNGISTHKG